MKKTYITILAMLLTAVSCVQTIEIPVDVRQGRLYVECLPCNDCDTTFIRLASALPINSTDKSKALDDIRIDFRVNGTQMDAAQLSEENGIYTYIVLGRLSQGDEITLVASAAGVPETTSSSVIPGGCEGLELVGREIHRGHLRHIFKIRRENNDGIKRYYGVSIEGKTTYEKKYHKPEYGEDETVTKDIVMTYEAQSSFVFQDDEIMNFKTITQAWVNGREIVIFEDDGGASKEITVTIDVPHDEDMNIETGPEYTIYRHSEYNVSTYNIGKNGYKYINPQINYALLGAGLIPPFINYSNISGGYGVNEGMGKTESGWMTNVK